MSQDPIYKAVTYWAENYGKAGIPDDRAVQTFMDCETAESVRSLRNELQGVAEGRYRDHSMDLIVGVNRRLKHGSYGEWAKMMLLWISSYKT